MRTSAGILLYRLRNNYLEVFLVHPGGPYWKGKEEGAWSIPKGEFGEGEDGLDTARREFGEETGQEIKGYFIDLGVVQQKGGKQVYAWAVEGDIDAEKIRSNSFRQEWPYKSGKWITVPEVDKGGWFSVEETRHKINPAQFEFIDRLVALLKQSDQKES
ncbi:MAG TPA: NUDIX domain-containing protein [Chitinophagaceae bacterium]